MAYKKYCPFLTPLDMPSSPCPGTSVPALLFSLNGPPGSYLLAIQVLTWLTIPYKKTYWTVKLKLAPQMISTHCPILTCCTLSCLIIFFVHSLFTLIKHKFCESRKISCLVLCWISSSEHISWHKAGAQRSLTPPLALTRWTEGCHLMLDEV